MPVSIPSPRSGRRARIEIVPLIDIIFFLLATFVMVSLSMVKNNGIPVKLPTATSGAPQERNQQATISITRDGSLFFNKIPLQQGELAHQLKEWKSTVTEPRIFIHGDAESSFQSVISVLDEVRRQGITRIAIETTPRR